MFAKFVLLGGLAAPVASCANEVEVLKVPRSELQESGLQEEGLVHQGCEGIEAAEVGSPCEGSFECPIVGVQPEVGDQSRCNLEVEACFAALERVSTPEAAEVLRIECEKLSAECTDLLATACCERVVVCDSRRLRETRDCSVALCPVQVKGFGQSHM